ncbi:phosphoribosylglycinamide formyltransferase [Bacteriovorax sp. PP10]|uniref:Phosphoribosylglycinamide formyltransferase n=1 Tax=Bacteriovorax antarcticus TaxID=3088717 RepID=A0ABU5VXM2_9BACT|nr:phosphoribosylglycinamide formyltransferase [Bacteriovorax sp. PP10]MEA9357751.1 phosphoribosylglycinamide formyltransferase [Bacteriovorax sp. PP10]
MTKIKIAILASGSGSNAQAIMNWARTSDMAEVVCVLSDKKSALVLERAATSGVPALLVRKKKSESRLDFDQKMIVRLADYNPDWIVLAGFMKLLTPHFLNVFKNKIVNIHPSLLPLFPGTDGYGDAFRAGGLESGCTVHFVDEGMDTGKIIDQKKFELIHGESFEEFKARGLKIENEFYPMVLEKLFKGLL